MTSSCRRSSDIEQVVGDGEEAVDDDEQDDARHHGARRGVADGRGARPRSAGRAGSRCRRSAIANTNDLTNPARKSVSVTALSTSFRNVTIGIENDCIVSAPPTMPTRSENSVEQRRHQHRGDDPRRDQEAHRVEPHRRQRVDLLVDAHRADLGRERRAGAAGEQDRRHQRPELAQHRQADQVGDEDLGAEALHRHRRLEREDHAEQERDQRDDRQRVGADLLADAPDVLQRTLRGLRTASTSAATVSPMNSTCVRMSRQTPYAARADLLDRRPSRRLRIEIVLEHRRIELLQQRLERGLEVRDLDRRLRADGAGDRRRARCRRRRSIRRRAASTITRTRGHFGQRAPRVVPQLAEASSASRRPDSASMRRPSGVSLIASAAMAVQRARRTLSRRARAACRRRARDRLRARTARRRR